MESNANHIIPSYFHLPVSYRSLVDCVVPLGNVSRRFRYGMGVHPTWWWIWVATYLCIKISGFSDYRWKVDQIRDVIIWILYFTRQWTLLSSRLLSKNLKIKIYKTIILPVVIYGCETWSLTLREESRLKVLENRILRRIFGPKRDEKGSGEGFTMRNFIVCTVRLI